MMCEDSLGKSFATISAIFNTPCQPVVSERRITLIANSTLGTVHCSHSQITLVLKES